MDRRWIRLAGLSVAVACFGSVAAGQRAPASPRSAVVQFIFTSDAHYGITRRRFRGASNVDAHIVNAAMIARINALPDARFPNDGGLRAGAPVGVLDFLAEGGDVANRSEVEKALAIQSASVSWSQFRADYLEGLTVSEMDETKLSFHVVTIDTDAGTMTVRECLWNVDPGRADAAIA